MANKVGSVLMAVLAACMFSATASAAWVEFPGVNAVSTADSPYGEQALLGGGESISAFLFYNVETSGGVTTLTLTVLNNSPAVTGTDAPTTPDAPVISAVMFSVPVVIADMTLDTVGGLAAGDTGWDFAFDPDAVPSTGFGFLKSTFDAFADGGPPGDPAPVIASIQDPDINDGPGDPIASPVDFVFTLTFAGGSVPAGFSNNWFGDEHLDYPDYIAAIDFMSGANGGSATVASNTFRPDIDPVPAPTAIMSLVSGLAILGGYRLRRRS